jgi:hypothetical protein
VVRLVDYVVNSLPDVDVVEGGDGQVDRRVADAVLRPNSETIRQLWVLAVGVDDLGRHLGW